MNEAVGLFLALLKVRVLQRRLPLFLGWNLTFRCNLRCQYCGAEAARGPELDTSDVCRRLDVFWKLGARWVTFGGGEPLLRQDLGTIVQYARKRGYRIYLSTNGILLPQRLTELKGVRNVNLSLDGPEEVHDQIRGKGAFSKTLAAIEACGNAGIPVSLQCVLSALNLQSVREVVRLAEENRVSAMFQPATRWLDSSTEPNPIAPSVNEYREAMQLVLELKRAGKPVRNSRTGIRHLMRWPDPTPIWCPAGRLACEIEPDGTVLACHQAQVAQFLNRTAVSEDPTSAFKKAVAPRGCAQCWCAPLVEMALIFSLKPEAVYNAYKIMRS